MKTIVTHMSPDLDACASTWLVRTYIPGFEDANYAFVPAGRTLNDAPPESDADVIHTDTGLGRFDHHQFKAKLSATKVIFDYLKENELVKSRDAEPLERFVDVVNTIDNFGEAFFPDPTSDIYEFALHQFIDGMRPVYANDKELLLAVHNILQGVFNILRTKVYAEKELDKGAVLQTKWGRTLAMESKNEEAMKIALKKGFLMVIRKDPSTGFLRIKTLPDGKQDLTPAYEALKKADPQARWFLHSSLNILLNGSMKDPSAVPTKLDLATVIEIIKKIK